MWDESIRPDVDGPFSQLTVESLRLQEEAELRSDGTKATTKPAQQALARVTCIRCTGPLSGEPFIDDYISTQEAVRTQEIETFRARGL